MGVYTASDKCLAQKRGMPQYKVSVYVICHSRNHEQRLMLLSLNIVYDNVNILTKIV